MGQPESKPAAAPLVDETIVAFIAVAIFGEEESVHRVRMECHSTELVIDAVRRMGLEKYVTVGIWNMYSAALRMSWGHWDHRRLCLTLYNGHTIDAFASKHALDEFVSEDEFGPLVSVPVGETVELEK